MATKTNNNSNNNAVNVINRMHSILKEYSKDAKKTKDKYFANYLMSGIEFTKDFEQSAKNYVKVKKMAECLKNGEGCLDCKNVRVWLGDELNIEIWVKYHIIEFVNRYGDEIEKSPFNRDTYRHFATAIFEQELGVNLL